MTNVYEFGPFRLDPTEGLLLRDGTPVPLMPKTFELLRVLVENRGRLLQKDELMKLVWPESFVEEGNLSHHVFTLRKALGEDKGSAYIETVPKRGYRFIAPVREVGRTLGLGARSAAVDVAERTVTTPDASPPVQPLHGGATAEPGRWRFTRPAALGGAIVVALLAAGGAFLWQRRPPAPPLTDKDVLVLADFTNSTGEPVFDGTLREALAVELDRSPFLNVMNDAQVRQILRLMGRAPAERITDEIAREVCLRGREKAMIGGSIAGLGTSYAIILLATNCATGETLAREHVEATEKEQVLTAVGVAATRMRTKLGESLGSIQELERHSALSATTPSLDAFQAYARGLLQFRRGLWLQAVPFLERATELDPQFAMAFQVLSHAYWNAGERRRSVEYSREAFALIERVSERERLAISAIYYIRVTGEAKKITDALEVFQQTFPRISIPRDFRGGFYYSMGEFEKAARDFEEAVRLDPRGWIPHVNLIKSVRGPRPARQSPGGSGKRVRAEA